MTLQPQAAATHDEAAWQALCDYLERDPQGRDLLRSIRGDAGDGFARFETWLTERHDALPPAIQVKVAGGEMRDLWNIGVVHHLNVQLPPAPTAEEERDLRNRSLMLEEVDRQWVGGWLEQSVNQSPGLRIDLELVASAVPDPWDGLVDRPIASTAPKQPACGLDAFNDLGHRLLILGAPGAGKTIALLEIVRALLTRAELKSGDPIPVVFLLAPWAVHRPRFKDWLVDELVKRYRVSRRLSEAWVNGDHIIPLLDGLDELHFDARAACVDAINLFQTDRPESFAELVVTCRSDDYFALSNRLNMTGAVMLRPLASQAIVSLLTSAGAQFEGIRQALERDPALRDLAATPLVLDLLMRTYRGAGVDSLPLSGDKPMRLEQLFAAYAELMLRRRSGHAPYTRGQSVGWLTWLANGLARESQSVLYIERLQPDWLTTRAGRIAYPLLDRLVFGFLLGVLEGAIAALVIDPLWALGFAAVVAVAVCLSGRTTEGDRSAWRAVSAFLLGGLATGGVITLLLFAAVRSGDQSQILPTAALVGALVGAPMAALAGGPWIGARRIRLVERVSWSLSPALRSATASLSGVALIAVILVLAALGQSQGMIKIGLLVAIALGAPPALVTAVLGGFVSKDLVDETHRRTPNQGIVRGGRTALIAAGLSALASGASIVVTFGLFGSALGSDIFFLGGPFRGLLERTPAQVQVAVVLGVIFASLYGLIGGLAYGGYAYLSHFALRLTLWREHAMPLDYVRFLNYANDCVLLRRVGGGYKFVHGLLQDYFAGLSRDPQR